MKPGEWDLFRVSPGESHWTAKWRLTWEGRGEGPGRAQGRSTVHVLGAGRLLPGGARQGVGGLSSERTRGQRQAGTPRPRPGALTVRPAAVSRQLGAAWGSFPSDPGAGSEAVSNPR